MHEIAIKKVIVFFLLVVEDIFMQVHVQNSKDLVINGD